MTHDLTELDRMLAEKVMGWKLFNYKTFNPASTEEHYADARRNDGWYWSGLENEEAHRWHPTTDIAQAFMVAAKIGELRVEQRPVGYWWVRFAGTMEYQEADTPTLAICLAAKAWLEGRKEGDAQ